MGREGGDYSKYFFKGGRKDWGVCDCCLFHPIQSTSFTYFLLLSYLLFIFGETLT